MPVPPVTRTEPQGCAHVMKVIIQIPCYNEEKTLPETLADLPRELPGVDRVEWLVVDDGSTDRTAEVARAGGVDHVVRLSRNRGLARAFVSGLETSLTAGADIIVNTDGDNQYRGEDVSRLVAPILAGEAEIVVGARAIEEIEHFSPLKKFLQRVGSRVVRVVSRTEVEDATSGFRAFSREAALRLNVFDGYTYTLETLVQAGQRGITVTSVPIRTNPMLRPSRLIRSTPSYLWRSVLTLLRVFLIYKPLQFFLLLGSVPFLAGFLLGVRYLVFLFGGTQRTHAPSLILASVLLLMGFALWIFGLVAELLSINRRLLEDAQLRGRRRELEAAVVQRQEDREAGGPATRSPFASR